MPKTGRVIVLAALVLAAARWAAAEDARIDALCAVLPANISVPGPSKVEVRRLLAASPTVRRQCAEIAAASVHVTILASARRRTDCRARAEFHRSASGHLDAVIDVPFGRDFPELVAHEFEHVLEQIEGLDLARLSEQPESGVVRRADGSYETRRARLAGRLAAIEVETQTSLGRQARATFGPGGPRP